MRRLLAVLLCMSLVLGLVPIPWQMPIARAAAVPSVTLSIPPETMIGESLTFTATFDNTSGDTGYGPFIDLVFPYNGMDGAHGTATPDGLSFIGATYLGTSVTATVLPFPDDDGAGAGTTGHVLHPYVVDTAGNPLWVYGTAGDRLVVLQLPFGSFTGAQPAASIVISASLSNLADLNTALTVRARAGFQYGNTAVSDPATDPSIVSAPSTNSSTWAVTAGTTPTVLRLRKVYAGPEDETATGPNYVKQYTVIADIAAGQTVTNLDLTDVLPGNLQFVSVDNVTPAGSVVTTPSTTTPGGTLTRRIASVTGTAGTSDALMTFSFYVPLLDASLARVINPVTGDDAPSPDDARAEGDWIPVDARDLPTQHLISNAAPVDHLLADKSIAIQKSVAIVTDILPAGLTPGDTLEYTLDFQVSDYFAFQNVRISSDVISDGQHVDLAFTPTLSMTENAATTGPVSFGAGLWSVTSHYTGSTPPPTAPVDGTSTLTFDISGQLAAARGEGRLLGGLVQPAIANDGATTGQIKFRTTVLDKYVDTFPSGSPSLDEGDSIGNSVTITGDVLDNIALNSTGSDESDGSSAGATIAEGTLSKYIYAINGSTTLPSPLRMAPGDLVTYRISYMLTISDFELLHLTDFLPLPVFKVSDYVWSKDAIVSNTAPIAGQWKYLTTDSYHVRAGAGDPVLTVDSMANSLDFNYGTHEDPGNEASVIDLAFSVVVSGDPFADGLFLTNQVRQTDQNTDVQQTVDDAIVQIQLTEPVLRITKGVVATDRVAGAVFVPSTVGPVAFNVPGTAGVRWTGTIASAGLVATPINSNLTGVDAGDKVTYVIVVENTGSGLNGAFDVQVKDALPAGYTVADVSNLRVADGTGAVLATTNVGAGSGLFDLGIELTDPGATAVPTGALDPYDAGSGRNVVVITYDLMLKASLPASSVLTNTGSLLHYAGLEGGTNHLISPLTDPASVTTAPPALTKTRVDTEIVNGNNTVAQAVVGEIITYQLSLTVSEGITGAMTIVDTMDAGLAYVGPVTFTNSNNVQVTMTGSALPVVTNNGQTLTFSLGDITNANSDNTTPETITLEYPVVVLNVGGNIANTQLNNSARMTWTGGSPTTVSAPNTPVIQPSLIVVKSVVPGSGDAGDEVTFSISVTNVNSATGTDAFDVVVSDTIPVGLTYVAGSVSFTAGAPAAPAPVLSDAGAPVLTASWGTLPKNTTGTITFKATLDANVLPGQSIPNSTTATWTTLLGTPSPVQRSSYNASSTERSLTTTSQATVAVYSVAPVKSIVATSESSTTGSDVTIGEIVRYHLSVLLPEGSSPAFQIVDALPAGLTFLNDGTATVAFVATGTGASAGIVSSDAGLGILPQISGSTGAVTPTFALPIADISPATFTDGVDPTFGLGDLTNYDRDLDSEYVVLEFNTIVSNVVGNTTNRNLDNTFSVRINGISSGLPSNSVRVTLRQPALTTTKVVTHAPVDAGDTVTYRITVTNSGNATAFDIVVNDPLDPTNHYIDLFNAADVVIGGSAVGVVNNSNAGTDVVNVTATSLAAGASMTIDITAHVIPGLPTGQISIPNTSTTTWTSLPGFGTPDPNGTGSVADAAGSTTGERTGTGGVNSYTTSGSATIVLPKPVRLVKTIVAINGTAVTDANRPFRVQPGDVVTFQLKLENRGATDLLNTLQLTDTLPAGWSYVASSSSWRLTNGSVPAFPGTSVTPGIVGQVLTWTPGQTLAATDDAGLATGLANDTLWLQFRATVTSGAASSVGGSANVNTANLIAADVPAPAIDLTDNWDSALVFRPELLLVKSVYSINGSTANVTQAQAGDVVRYRIIVRNTSAGADAEALVVTDTLPVGVSYVNGSSLTTWSNAGSSAVDPAGTTTRTWSYASSIVKPGENLTLFYSVLVASTTPLGRATNTASASGTDGQGQSYAAVGPDRASGTAQAQFDVYKPVLRLTKTASAAGVAVSTLVDFTIKVENLDSYARAQSINLNDTLPSGWTYSAGTSYLVRNNGTAPVWGSPIADPTGSPLAWTFNEVLQPTDDQGGTSGSSLDTLWFRLTAVPGVASEGRGNVNTAQATFADASGTAMPPVADSVTICVGSPRLEMTKTVDQNVTEVGQARTFLLRTINQNAVSALSVSVDDYLPTGWEFVAGSAWWNLNNGTVPVAGTAIVPTAAGSRLTFATSQTIVGTDDLGGSSGTAFDTLWVRFQARATSAAVQGINTNTAAATGTDPGSPSRPVGSNIGSAALTLNKPQIAISKSVDVPTPGAGGIAVFTVLVTNTGNENLVGATITDTLPAGLTFVSASGGGIHAAGVVTWSGLTVVAGNSATFTVNVRVDKNTPNGQALVNSASVSGQDSGGNTIAAGPATAVVAVQAPTLSIAKSGSPNPVKAGQTVTWTITVANIGSQAATGVSVTDLVPTGLTFVSADAGGLLVTGVVTWSGQSVPAAGSLTLHWTGTVASPIADNTVIPNTATVDSSEAGPITSPPAAVVVSSAPQLNICKAGSQDPVKAGNEFTYTIRYANNSTMNVTGATIVEVYPTGVTFVSASPAPTSGNNTWLIGNLGAGSSGIITITVRVDASVADGTLLTNVVSISNDQTQTVQAQAIIHVGTGASLQVAKSDLKDPVPAGGTLTYTLSFANSGSTNATGVQLVDDYGGFAGLPILGGGTADMTLNSWSVTSGPASFTMTQDAVNHTLTFVPTAGTIPGRTTGTITVVFDIPANVMDGTTRTNTVTLSSIETNAVSDSESTTISSAPALHVTKTASPSVQAGGLITYTIEYWNDGAANATGVVVTESYSPLVSFVSATVVPDAGTNNVWTIGLVINDAVHHSIVITCRAAAPLADGTVIPNTVTLDSDQTVPQTAAASTTIGSAPILTMTKSVTGSPVIAGQNLVYTLTVGNTGNADATGTVVTDATPANTTFISARFVSGTGSITSPAVGSAGTVTWTLGAPLSPGAQVVVELVVKTNTPLDNGLTITNTATVNCVEDPTGVTGAVPGTITSAPVLHLVKDAPANVNAGDTITYALHITNTGNMNAHGVVTADATPVHTTFVSARFVSGGTGTITAPAVGSTGTVTWTLDPAQMVVVGSELVLELIVRADSPLPNGTLIPNAADVVSAEILTPVTADTLTIVGSSPVLTVIKSVLPASFVPGENLTYTVTLRNSGNMVATGVTINDSTPLNTTFVSASWLTGTGTIVSPAVGATGLVTWTPTGGTLGIGQEITVRLVVATPRGLSTGTVIINSAIADSAETERVTSTVQAIANGAPVLVLTKTAFPTSQKPGGIVTWALLLRNIGTVPATNVVVTESYDASFTYQFANPPPDAGTNNRWTIGTIPVDTTVAITIIGQLSEGIPVTTPPAVIGNTATAACSELVPVRASAAITVLDVRFGSTGLRNFKSVTPTGSVAPGATLAYAITYTNTGNDSASNVTVVDYLDPNLDESALHIGSGGTYNSASREITWVIPSLPAMASGVVSFTVRVRLGFDGGVIYDRASIGVKGVPPTVTNTVTTYVYPTPVVIQPEVPVTPPTPPASIEIGVSGTGSPVCLGAGLDLGLSLTNGKAPFTWTVNYGDGAPAASGVTSDRVLALHHQFARPGTYALAVTVQDAAGMESSHRTTVIVQDCTPADVTVYHHNFFIGYPDKPFLPERPISRAEVAGALSRALGLGWSVADPQYPDVTYTHWGTGFIALMQEEGIMQGDTGGTFRPDAFITRAEAAAVFLRLLKIAPAATTVASYPDVPAGHWAAGVIAAMRNVGLLEGYPDGTFRPDAQIRRSEFAVLACRALGRQMLPVNQLEDVAKLVNWDDVPETYWAYWAIVEVSTPHVVTNPERLDRSIVLRYKTIPLYAEVDTSTVTFVRYGDQPVAIVPVDGMTQTGSVPSPRSVFVQVINHQKP